MRHVDVKVTEILMRQVAELEEKIGHNSTMPWPGSSQLVMPSRQGIDLKTLHRLINDAVTIQWDINLGTSDDVGAYRGITS